MPETDGNLLAVCSLLLVNLLWLLCEGLRSRLIRVTTMDSLRYTSRFANELASVLISSQTLMNLPGPRSCVIQIALLVV